MAVPNTNTFSLQDVVNEVNPTTNDLQDCFSDASSSDFNPSYNNDSYAPANSLLRFRDYIATQTLTVTATSAGSTPIALIGNYSTSSQAVTFNWRYVSQSADINTSVVYNGSVVSVNYTTPTLSGTLTSFNEFFDLPFSFFGGNDCYITFEFTLLTAAVDNVPSSPNNKVLLTYQHNTGP
jgi:hypothetical protein